MKPDLLSLSRAVAQVIPERLHLAGIEDGPLFRPRSPRATTATLLLDAGADIRNVWEFPGHRHVITTQTHDNRRRSTPESAAQLLTSAIPGGQTGDRVRSFARAAKFESRVLRDVPIPGGIYAAVH
jgi:hypothetical protein